MNNKRTRVLKSRLLSTSCVCEFFFCFALLLVQNFYTGLVETKSTDLRTEYKFDVFVTFWVFEDNFTAIS